MPQDTRFIEPSSIEDAYALRAKVVADVQEIQGQLGDKQRTDESGERLGPDEYWSWRRRAQGALKHKLEELRFLKQWIRNNQRPFSPSAMRPGADPSTYEALRHVQGLLDILKVLESEGVTLDPEELNKINAAREMLVRVDERNRTAPPSGQG